MQKGWVWLNVWGVVRWGHAPWWKGVALPWAISSHCRSLRRRVKLKDYAVCAGWTAEAETRAGQVGRWGQEGGEQRLNFQALGMRFYEGIYEAVFPKKEKGKMPATAVRRGVFLPRCVGLQLFGCHRS